MGSRDGDLDLGDNDGGGEILNCRVNGYVDGLDMGCEMTKGVKNYFKSFVWSNRKKGVEIDLRIIDI